MTGNVRLLAEKWFQETDQTDVAGSICLWMGERRDETAEIRTPSIRNQQVRITQKSHVTLAGVVGGLLAQVRIQATVVDQRNHFRRLDWRYLPRRRDIWTKVDAIADSRQLNLIAGQQGSTNDSLAIDASAVGASQISQIKQPVGLDEDAMLLGHVRMVNNQIA